MTFQPGQVIRTSEGQVFTVVVHRTPLSFGSQMSETSDQFAELELVVRREMRATLEVFDAGFAQMQLSRDRLQACLDDFVANVSRVSEGTPQ